VTFPFHRKSLKVLGFVRSLVFLWIIFSTFRECKLQVAAISDSKYKEIIITENVLLKIQSINYRQNKTFS